MNNSKQADFSDISTEVSLQKQNRISRHYISKLISKFILASYAICFAIFFFNQAIILKYQPWLTGFFTFSTLVAIVLKKLSSLKRWNVFQTFAVILTIFWCLFAWWLWYAGNEAIDNS